VSAVRPGLHLIPVGLANTPCDSWLPADTRRVAAQLEIYIAENARSARAFLKQIGTEHPLQSILIHSLDARTDVRDMRTWLAPLGQGKAIGLVSEAGCPAVADPGARVVALAHAAGHAVIPHVGPSSILLGLMASGLDGQRFSFHGYAPVKPPERARQLRQWETQSRRLQQTQILIETPYRNMAMFDTLLQTLAPATRLCIACELTGPGEWIRTRTVDAWRNGPRPELAKRACLFLFQA